MSETPRIGQRRLWLRRLRIVTGLILLAYVTSHLINAALGVISNEAMDAARPYLTSPWGKLLPGSLLAASLVAHFLLGLWSIYRRPTLRTNAQDMVQILSSVLILPLLAIHGVGTSMASRMGLDMDYALIIRTMWIDLPWLGLLQVVMLTVVWVHGAAGLITWLRAREGARAVLVWVYPLAVVIPIAALLGFSEAGRRVLSEAPAATGYGAEQGSYGATAPAAGYGADTGYGTAPSQDTGYGATPAQDTGYGTTPAPQAADGYGADADAAAPPELDMALISRVTDWVIWGSALLALLTFAARLLRRALVPHQPVYAMRDGAQMAVAQSGLSLLDIFRASDQPHASLCEGRGRCATCAVRILSAEFPLPEPDALEARTLASRDLPDGVRLACQVCPGGGNIKVVALYPPDYTFDDPKPELTPDTVDPAAEARIEAPA